MVSKTSICNKALRKIGVKPIMNIDTDDSKQATTCKAAYDDVLLEVLRAYNWNFAVFRQSLNLDASGSPAFGFANRFILPTIPVFIKLINVENNPDFKLENNFLITNEESINIRFVGKETDPNKYDTIFIDVLAARLAAEVAYFLTSDKALVTKLEQEFLTKLSVAKGKDFQEDNQKPLLISSFNSSRFTSFDRNANDFSPITEDA